MSNDDINVSGLSDVALESIVTLQAGSELAIMARHELKRRKAREKEEIEERQAREEMQKTAPPPVPNMPSLLHMEESTNNLKETINRMRNELKGE